MSCIQVDIDQFWCASSVTWYSCIVWNNSIIIEQKYTFIPFELFNMSHLNFLDLSGISTDDDPRLTRIPINKRINLMKIEYLYYTPYPPDCAIKRFMKTIIDHKLFEH